MDALWWGLLLLAGIGGLAWWARHLRRGARPQRGRPPAAPPSPARSADPFDAFVLGDRSGAPPQAAAAAGHEPRDELLGGSTAPGPAEDVDIAAVVPRAVAAGVPFRVQAVLAPQVLMPELLKRLQARSPQSVAAEPATLFEPPASGAVVELTLVCAAATAIEPRCQRVTWRGRPVSLAFQLTPGALEGLGSVPVEINVFVDRVCIGHLSLDLAVAAQPDGQTGSAALQRARRVFMSYTGVDREPVLQVARALRRFGIEPFMDRLTLEGGEDWEARIEAELDRCDAFMLFWSPAAARSDWVLRETRRALERQGASAQRRPHIVTHLLGPPPPAAPPAGLERLHFNDPAYALWEMATQQGSAH